MGKKQQGDNGAPLTLLQLQNLIKRDPESYQEEFLQQLRHFDSSVEIFTLNPSADSNNFGELATFLAHTCTRYPKHGDHVQARTMSLLENYASVMQPLLRREMCHAVMMMKGKGDSGVIEVFRLFFKLFKVKDKVLRESLRNHITTEIKRMNAKTQKNQINKALQGMMFQFVNDEDPIAAHMSVMVMIELYRKGAWQDRKTVNVMAAACLSPHMKVVVAALQFFLGIDDQVIMDREEDKAGDDGHETLVAAQMAQRVGKKTKSKARQVDRVKQSVKKENRRQGADDVGTANFSALHLINDPQGLAEKLFTNLKKCTERYEVRLMMMNLISRLIGVHELTILNFYPFIIKFFQPKQPDVTKILAYGAQACHEMVPPDTVEQMITALANNFVTERCSSEVMTVGLNSIRGMCARSPLAMNSTLMSDLAEYKSYKDKSVMMAAKSLIGLLRDINPEVLPKKDRGFAASTEGYTAANYGEARVADHVPGAEYLKQPGEESSDEENGGDDDGWASDSSFENGDIEGDWVKVHDDDDRPIDDGDKKAPMTQEEMIAAKDAAKLASVSRVFTEDDFKRIRRGKVEAAMLGNNKRKRGAEDAGIARKHDEIIDVNDIEKLSKRQKMDKDARRETVLEGRVDREKYMSKRARRKATGEVGMTQKENQKKKNFLMVSRSFAVHSKKTMKQVEKIRQNRASRKKNSIKMRK